MERRFAGRTELYHQIESALAHIIVFEGDEVISKGTGFACSAEGAIVTAAHVVAGGFPIRPGEVDQTNRRIIACFADQQQSIVCKPAICPFEITCGGMKPVQLDIALLVPVTGEKRSLKYLSLSTDPPKLGEEMFIAGYSDEVEFPFLIDRHIQPKTSGIDLLQREAATGLKERLAGPLIKRGTVGNIRIAIASGKGSTTIRQSVFYLDNQIHSGASGGPIVSADGIARGVIVKRMTTKLGDGLVSSGSTLGIGLEPLLLLVEQSARSRAKTEP